MEPIVLNDAELSSLIKKHRKNKNITQKECSVIIGIPRPTYASCENNHRNFNYQIGLKISTLLSIPIHEFDKRLQNKTNLKDTHPQIWNELINKVDISTCSTSIHQFKCNTCNYEYHESILKRTQRNKHCQMCNSIASNCHEIMNFFDYENNTKTPYEISKSSNNKIYFVYNNSVDIS